MVGSALVLGTNQPFVQETSDECFLFLKHLLVWLHGPPTLIHGCEGPSLQSIHRVRNEVIWHYDCTDMLLWRDTHNTVSRCFFL